MKFLIRLNVGTILVAAFLNLLMIQFSLAAPLNDGVNAISNKVTTKQLNAKNAFSFHREVLHSLMLDLYECKPDELKKSTKVSKEEYAQWVFEGPFDWKFDAIRNMQSSEAIMLSFNQQYCVEKQFHALFFGENLTQVCRIIDSNKHGLMR